jgi:DinB superfamily
MTSLDGTPSNTQIDAAALRAMLKSQYHAALAMLRDAVERCPDEVWLDTRPRNAFWQVAYHALFFADFYLLRSPEAFQPWEGHQANVQNPNGIAGPPNPSSSLPLLPEPYTKAQVLAYWALCDAAVDPRVDALDLASPESGFYWYKIPKLEHQLVNLRHIQHHTGQLVDRLRGDADIGIRWVGSRKPQ